MYLNSAEALITYAEAISKKHTKVLLIGELGAGKTTFAKGFARGLGIDETKVTSPTYTYQNIYDQKLLHIDMYRIEKEEHLQETGLLELIDQYEYIVIEWPKWQGLYTDSTRAIIDITKHPEGGRQITYATN